MFTNHPNSLGGGGGGNAFNVIGGTGQFADGTAAAPSITILSDTDTGFYWIGTGALGYTSDGVASLRFIQSTSVAYITNATSTSTFLSLADNGAAALTAGGTNQNVTLSPSGTGFSVLTGGANGQASNIKTLTELTTIAAAATTDTVIQIPAGAIVVGVSVRVTVAITSTSTFNYGIAGATARYGTAVSKVVNTTYAGTDDGLRFYGSAISIRFTPDSTPSDATGRVRTTIHYLTLTPPTS